MYRDSRLLSEDEEIKLFHEYKAGSVQAFNRLVESKTRMVIFIVSKCKSDIHMQDSIQEGLLGVMRALQKWDPSLGASLATYTYSWIRHYVYRSRLSIDHTVRRHPCESLSDSCVEDYYIDSDVRMDGYGTPREVRARSKNFAWKVHTTLANTIVDDHMSVEDIVAIKLDAEFLWKELKSYSSDERELVIMRDRILSDNPELLGSLGKRWGVSRERVRQIESRMLRRMRKHFGIKEETDDTSLSTGVPTLQE